MKKFLISSGKKLVTYIFVFALLATAVMAGFTGIDIGVKATGGVWAGSGTEADPYEIADEQDLREVVKCGGVDAQGNRLFFELVADIQLNDTSNWSNVGYGLSQFTQWEVNSGDKVENAATTPFQGHLQGNGHTISGLYSSGNQGGVGALFPLAAGGATVTNVKLDKFYVDTNAYAGAVFGRVVSGGTGNVEISYVSVTDSFIKSWYSGVGGAGIVGEAHHGGALKIEGCSFVANSKGGVNGAFAGAMIGDAWSCSIVINNCWSSGCKLVSDTKIGSFTITNCYSDVQNTSSLSAGSFIGNVPSMKGVTAADCPKLDTSVTWEFVSGDYPKLRNVLETVNGTEGSAWSGATAKSFASGTGTKFDPYIIKTGEQLARMIDNREVGAYYKLGADIILNNTADADWYESALAWKSNGTYAGVDNSCQLNLEGDGHKIIGLCIRPQGQSTASALIPLAGPNTTITNVHIVDSYLKGQYDVYENFAVGFIGSVADGAHGIIIGGCSIDDTVIFDGGQKGAGFIGCMPQNAGALIYNCAFSGQIDPAGYPNNGGAAFLADSWTQNGGLTIQNSYSYGAPAVAKANGNSGSSKCYVTVSQEDMPNATSFPVTVIAPEAMIGDAAKDNMQFDWDAWTVVPNGLPIPSFDLEGKDGIPGKVWSGLCADNYHPYTADYAYPAEYSPLDPADPTSRVVNANGEYFYGDGTDEYPFHIATGEQLYKMVSQNSNDQGVGVRYDLIADIYLNDINSEDWANKENLNQWWKGSQWSPFRGHFNGNGHIVVGLYYNTISHLSTMALIPCLGESGVVEKVGVVSGYIYDDSYSKGHIQYVASIVGYIHSYGDPGDTTKKLPLDELKALGFNPPIIRECFGDADTTLRGSQVGGIVCGIPSPFIMEDCYFLGTVRGSKVAGIVGDCWPQNSANCYRVYCLTTDDNAFGKGNWVSSGEKIGCYAFELESTGGVSYVPALLMRGDLAKQNMPLLFENCDKWQTVENGSPVLKVFGDRANQFSDTKDRPIVIEFSTGDDNIKIPSVSGKHGDPITLPTPTKKGYAFEGWYYYKELQCKAELTKLPIVGVTLYANWVKNTVTQDFENYPDTEYDRKQDGDYEIYRPGAAGYTGQLVHNGSKSLHRMGKTTTEEDVLLNYEDTLAKNTIYEASFWVATDEADAKATVSLVRNTWPDIDIANEPITGVQEVAKIENLTPGEWKQYTFKFTADTEWVSLRTTGGASLFFDDFEMVPIEVVNVSTSQAGGNTAGGTKPVDTNTAAPTAPLSPATADNSVSLVALISAFAAAAVVLLFSKKHLTEVIDN